ncbi:hypothetical protein BD779DRAFT_107797 [Infundibulicybe gibba]|nr:hypothetical protein BD779DRAFT_107797 [Infundibulicybe gibba]
MFGIDATDRQTCHNSPLSSSLKRSTFHVLTVRDRDGLRLLLKSVLPRIRGSGTVHWGLQQKELNVRPCPNLDLLPPSPTNINIVSVRGALGTYRGRRGGVCGGRGRRGGNAGGRCGCHQGHGNSVVNNFLKPIIVSNLDGRIKDGNTLFFCDHRLNHVYESVDTIMGASEQAHGSRRSR